MSPMLFWSHCLREHEFQNMDEKMHNPSHSSELYSENWQRFMILWSVTPEFYIGSCIICVFAIICVYIVTRNDSSTECVESFDDWAEGHRCHEKHKTEPRGHDHTMETANKNNHTSLRNRKRPSTVQAYLLRDELSHVNNASDESSNDDPMEFDVVQPPSPYKKSLYRMAAEKLEASLTEEQLREEREIQRQQLKAIYDLMRDKKNVFGIEEMSEVEEQMKYYG